MISFDISCREQDCVVVLAPYPNNPNPVESFNLKTDFDWDGLVWYARPQLFFNCTLFPTGLNASVHSGLHKEVSLVYFSTFEPIDLTPDSIMQRAGGPCSMTLPATRACPASTSARWPTFWARPPGSVLYQRQQSPHDPIPLQGRSAYWTRLRRHAAGPGQRKQGLRGEHLDVALRPGPPPDSVYRRGGEDQGRAAQREQDQGGRDKEVSQRGRSRSGGGERRRQSGLNTGQ
jgi:hypothetical protein